jgi:hypothetical protein
MILTEFLILDRYYFSDSDEVLEDLLAFIACHVTNNIPPKNTTLNQLIVRSTATRLIASESVRPNRISNPVNPPSTNPNPPGVGIVVSIALARAANIMIPNEISILMASATK